jgi:hypothetical protein
VRRPACAAASKAFETAVLQSNVPLLLQRSATSRPLLVAAGWNAQQALWCIVTALSRHAYAMMYIELCSFALLTLTLRCIALLNTPYSTAEPWCTTVRAAQAEPVPANGGRGPGCHLVRWC